MGFFHSKPISSDKIGAHFTQEIDYAEKRGVKEITITVAPITFDDGTRKSVEYIIESKGWTFVRQDPKVDGLGIDGAIIYTLRKK